MSFRLIQFLLIFLVFFLLLFFSYIENRLSQKNKKIIIIINIIFVSLIAGFRTIGTDTLNYINIYENTPIISSFNQYINNIGNTNTEPLFLLLISFIKSIGGTVNIFFAISACLPLLIISYVIFKIEDRYQITTFLIFSLLFLIRGPLDIIRQFFAMSVYLLSLYYIADKDKIKYYISNIIGSLFHYSSIGVFVGRPFLFTKKWTTVKYIGVLSLVFMLGFVLREVFYMFFINIESDFSAIIKFNTYVSSQGYTYSNIAHFFSRNFMEHFIPILNISLAVYILNKKSYIRYDTFSLVLFNSMILGTILYVFFMSLGESIIAIRINYSFSIGNFFIIKNVMLNDKSKNKTLKYFGILIVLILLNILIMNYYSGIYNVF